MTQTPQNASATIGIMAKFWQPGKVKTRLGATIGMDRSARLHKRFVQQLLHQLHPASDDPASDAETLPATDRAVPDQARRWQCQWVAAPPEHLISARQQLQTWGLPGVQVVDQGDGDLGQRMMRWFRTQLDNTSGEDVPGDNASVEGDSAGLSDRVAILIGADCPCLSVAELSDAFDKLMDSDVVIGPAIDGGYYLIGLRGPWHAGLANLFQGIRWSEPDVLKVTCERIEAAGMSSTLLPPREDVDTESELVGLRAMLSESVRRGDAVAAHLLSDIDTILNLDHEA